MPHTSEVKLRLNAPDWPGLLEQAALGLAEVEAGARERSGAEPSQELLVEGSDREDLLVAWLDELIFVAEQEGHPVTSVAIEEASERMVRARVGVGSSPLRVPVKAATFHELEVVETDGGLHADVVLDV